MVIYIKLMIGTFRFQSFLWLAKQTVRLQTVQLQTVRLQTVQLQTVRLQTVRLQYYSKLMENTKVYGPIKFEEIVIFMINRNLGQIRVACFCFVLLSFQRNSVQHCEMFWIYFIPSIFVNSFVSLRDATLKGVQRTLVCLWWHWISLVVKILFLGVWRTVMATMYLCPINQTAEL